MSATVAAVALLMAACGTPPPTDPGPPLLPLDAPTPESVVRVTNGNGLTSVRPMSADGRFVVYSLGNLSARVTDAHLWDASTGSTTDITTGAADGAPIGARTEPPFISNDGSTVVFTTTMPVVDGAANVGNSFFVYSVATADTQQVQIPGTYGTGPIHSVATSGDGSLIVVSYGDRILTWTAADGFGELSDPARLTSGTAFNFSAVGAPVSDNGRYVAIMAQIPATFSNAPGQCKQIEVHDLDEGSVTLGPCFDRDGLPQPELIPVGRTPFLTVTDQGGVVFGQHDLGIRTWSSTDGFRNLTGNFLYTWAASPDGNAVSYSDNTQTIAGSPGVGFLLINEPRGRATLGARSFGTRAVGIGAGADTVLLSTNEPAVVGPDPGTRSLWVWYRNG